MKERRKKYQRKKERKNDMRKNERKNLNEGKETAVMMRKTERERKWFVVAIIVQLYIITVHWTIVRPT